MRVLHLVSSEKWTGVAEPATSVAVQQRDMGCEVDFACVLSRSFERTARQRGLEPLDFLSLNRQPHPGLLWRDIRRLRKFIKETDVDVVHTHLPHDHWIAAFAFLGLSRRPLLVRTAHRGVQPRRDPIHRWLYGSATDLIITVSREIAAMFEKRLGLREPKVRVIYGGVDAGHFRPAAGSAAFRRELGIPDGAPLAGIVARMTETRGHLWLLDSFAEALKTCPGLHLALVGRGPMKKPLRQHIRGAEWRNRVHFAGYRKPEDLPQVYAGMDFHILLAQGSDGSCRAALEAMASGKANIVARDGVLPETVTHEQDGLIVEKDDVDGLAAAIARLGNNLEQAAAMGRRARKTVEERFDERIRAKATLQAYTQAMQEKVKGGRGLA